MDYLTWARLAVALGMLLMLVWGIESWFRRINDAAWALVEAQKAHTRAWREHWADEKRAADWSRAAQHNAAVATKIEAARASRDNESLAPAARELLAGLDRNTKAGR